MSVTIENLFTRNRIPLGLKLLLVILYTPFGIVLSVLRLFISLQLCLASWILPLGTVARKIVLRVLYCVMGVFIEEKDVANKDSTCPIIVSNHITPFDHLALSLVHPCILINSCNLPSCLDSILCYDNIEGSNRDIILSKIKSYLSKPNALPLLLFPERGSTNGNVALMKYSSWALDGDKPIMAIGIKVRRLPILPIAPSVLESSWVADLFFLLFSPATFYSIRYIGKFTRSSNESVEDFASRIQCETASAIGLEPSPHTHNDKLEYIKRLAREEAMLSNPFFSPEVHSMAMQVREVLPHLPLDIIKRDIVRTRNVDITITNFLEGNIPEPIPSSHSSSSGASSATMTTSRPTSPMPSSLVSGAGADLSTAAKSFGRTSTERMVCFETRKDVLIDKARQRYFAKVHKSSQDDSQSKQNEQDQITSDSL